MGVDLNPRHFVVGGGALEVLKGVGQGANEHNLVFEILFKSEVTLNKMF